MKNIMNKIKTIFDDLYNFYLIKRYYIFALQHRKHHKGGCIPYDNYWKLYKMVEGFFYKHNENAGIKSDYKILEIGTATGFTAFIMNLSCQRRCSVDTIEKNPEHIEIAKKKFNNFTMKNIKIIEGRAEEVMKNISNDSYDLFFLMPFPRKKKMQVIF